MCHWIRNNQVPKGKIAISNSTVVDIRPEKTDLNQVQFIAGENVSKYNGEISTKIASIETAKLLISSTLSTKGSKFMAMDISNFYI